MPEEIPEAQARELIDEQLRKVGWEVDTASLRHSRGSRPKAGRHMLIAECPAASASGEGSHADYAMFLGEQLVGFILLDSVSRKHVRSYEPKESYEIIIWNQKFYPNQKKMLNFLTSLRKTATLRGHLLRMKI